ncbi:GMC family oxidoreductase N-terminal domain-containing protein [Ancylobacter dichloromethanicus]|uniref:GMC family oxidoreductase N-terminal domain-containing protein n=1 Tax=Ancylobacter dichloromethanicus TaxID=518825 RepID=UPI00361BC7D0
MVPTSPPAGRAPGFFHQARVMGGGSSINAQIALRGLPRDFDGWQDAGAEGWNWEAVLPFFRKLEHDVDFRASARPGWSGADSSRSAQSLGSVHSSHRGGLARSGTRLSR